MRVHVKVNDSDYLRFSEYQLTHSKRGKRTILLQRLMLPAISTAMVIAFIAFHASSRALIIEIISLGLASAIWVIGAPGMLKSNMRRDYYKNKSKGKLPFRETSVLEFGDEGITEISGDYSEVTSYSSIDSIVKSDDRLYVITNGSKGFVVPLNDAARNGRRAAKLLADRTGIEITEESK